MKNLSLVFRSLALPVLLLTLNAAGAQEKQPLRYVDAATLTVIGKSMPTPKLFQRVDTARYELWQPVKNYSAFSTGLAVVFRTDSRTIRARWKTGGYGLGHNMTAIARKGLDLYIERDGQWVYAGFGWPKGDNHDSALVEYMDEGEKTCLVYLPLWDEVLSLELGIDGDSRIEAVPNPFRHRIVVLGSSITHGASAGRPGMTWTARLARRMGLDFLNLGYSGQCKLQPEFARMLAEMEADAFVFDAFSNPSAGEIEERLDAFVATVRKAHPSTPLIFIQTEVRETVNFNLQARKFESDKRAAAEAGIRRLMKDDRNIYFIDSRGMIGTDHLGTVDGSHPSDQGFMYMTRHLEPQLRKIFRKYGIRSSADRQGRSFRAAAFSFFGAGGCKSEINAIFASGMTEDFIQENEDRELFRRIKQGSEEAFRVVYGKYHRILYAVALKMLKDRSAAENAVQHVFVKLWIGRQEMTVMLSLRNYLYTMTRNYILNYLRSRNTELVHSYRLAQLVPEASDPLDAQIEREDLLQKLDTVIAGLPTQKRQVMYLRKAGYSNPEIAEMLNLSVNTVRSHYQEGVKLLKSRFGHIVLLIFILQTLFL